MLCVLEIFCLVYGIITLVNGRFPVGKNKEVRAPAAYLVGMLLIAVVPVAIILGIALNWDDIKNGGGPQPFQFKLSTVLPDLIAVFGVGGAAVVVALSTVQPKRRPKRRRRRVDDYDDYEDRPRRRRYEDDELDEDDDRPRPRRRRADYDDEDDRPRRRRDDLDDRAR
jgi:hypothetical protein